MDEKLTIGRYLIIKTIGKGGMGEVLLAYDPICKRNVALKRIRKDLTDNLTIKNRFLKEAKIASRLTHPSIIPIYSIHTDENGIYYTMPYVEGVMLKDILEEAKSDNYQNTRGSIPYLIRVFLNVCEAMAYSHSKNILHRDLKPANIMIGKYGEVLILDWGIANFINAEEKDEPSSEEGIEITKPGKIAGTVAFMAPERAFGQKATALSDIYSLGVILYQILTLTFPFQRRNLSYFRKYAKEEKLIDPIERAPYRDIPKELSEITKKCLNFYPEKRYQKVEEIIQDLVSYIEGKPKWLLISSLDINQKDDWAINENIFLPKYTAITQNSDFSEWVSLLIANKEVLGNIKIEADLYLKDTLGIGFLLSLPDLNTKFSIGEGYLLWLGFDKSPYVHLVRSNALVMEATNLDLAPQVWHNIKIEKNDTSFSFFLNNKLILTYVSHIPLAGTHSGLVFKDLNFEIKNLKLYSASNNVVINCLSVPDAFLAKKDFDSAYSEYKRIAESFPGRTEGVQALFRAGACLLEKAKATNDKGTFQKALDEFENLHKTHGAPLEYLGKSLVYAALLEYEEEAKCLELAIRKFKNHPLLPILKEHIIYRIHESSLQDREAAYRLILLTVLHIPSLVEQVETKLLIENLQKHWENLYFLIPTPNSLPIELSYRLGKKQTLLEILKSLKENEEENIELIENALFALLELGCYAELSEMQLEKYPLLSLALKAHFDALASINELFQKAPQNLEPKHIRVLVHILKYCLDSQNIQAADAALSQLEKHNLPVEYKELVDSVKISCFLYKSDFDQAQKILFSYPKEKLNDENSNLHPLYGIYLQKENSEKALNHFSLVIESPYPKTPSLLSHYLTERIEKWIKHAFWFEKKELYRQLSLFYRCARDDKKSAYFASLINEQSK